MTETKTVRRAERKTRNTLSPEDQETSILDAAAEEFAAVGVRRANVDEVAANAGVSRSTLYRRFPNKDALLAGVATRAYEQGMCRLEEAVIGMKPAEAIVEAFAVGAQWINDDPLLRRIVITDSELRGITSSLTSMFIDMVTRRVSQTLTNAGATMPEVDMVEAVEIHVRLVISYLEVPATDPTRNNPDRVREFAEKFLAPMIY